MIQNFKNHKRYSITYHFITVPLMIAAIWVAIDLFIENQDVLHGLMVCSFFLIAIVAAFARMFALKVQDRAARADERLRYYILSGKMLPAKLRMSQILALRFASDEEFVALVDRTLFDKLSSKEIKQAIVDWRADHDRV
ncbi:DUF6526 family protein [Pedobacter sp. Du54]|uniref:DUF6526 family protein n=1 Tax=Pedobacter anseongensis TaxID=3133439 RepID=UPI0030A0D69A